MISDNSDAESRDQMGMKKFMSKINGLEEAISGKPSGWASGKNNKITSGLALVVSIVTSVWMTADKYGSLGDELQSKHYVFLLAFVATSFLLAWTFFITIFKGTILKSRASAILGLIAAGTIFFLCNWLLGFVLVEANWGIVWSSRVQLFAGHEMNFRMVNDAKENEMWRLWATLALLTAVASSAYGTSDISTRNFVGGFFLLSVIAVLFTAYPSYRSYDPEGPITKFVLVSALGFTSFLLTRKYCSSTEEYQINRLKRYLAMLGVFTFFFSLFVMDPPDPVVERGWMESGLEPALWGGLFVNLILATAGGVLGLGIGVVLAFGRQSELPIFKWPSTALIETVRAGPMIAWLYFAKYLLEDVIVPFSDADAIMRTLLMFAFFGGVYTAEILRGGIQSISDGQIEAATALGLNPNQIKLTVILPNSVRTTLPSLVSLLIGLWKDTTLIFIIGIFDFFKIAKDLNTSDLQFALDILEPLYMAAFVFWIIAFYLSRISMGVERKLGLGSQTGGERT
tara:strand:- start:804 stop:2342 length:1539 start_codon:yes stop_codon:yes gene_type:complete